jgi:hypothetical protein
MQQTYADNQYWHRHDSDCRLVMHLDDIDRKMQIERWMQVGRIVLLVQTDVAVAHSTLSVLKQNSIYDTNSDTPDCW